MRIPLSFPSEAVVSIRKLACPIHVAFKPLVVLLKSGLRTWTRPRRSAGTGTKFFGVLKRARRAVIMPSFLYEGHGFLKLVGGLPM